MPYKLTLDTFLAALRRSGIVPEDRAATMLMELSKEGVDVSEPLAIADALVRKGTLTQWQAENLLQGKHRGFNLGKYRLLSLLGRGGAGAVYLAEHTLMRRRCAIKVLPTPKPGDSAFLTRFHREAQAVAALDHTNIVRAYDFDKAMDGKTEVHLLVMEFVDGESLHDRVVRKGPLEAVEAADYVRQAAEGLAYAHRSGIIHRDIKPANLLVARDGVVKILDLGLAKFFDDAPAAATARQEGIVGTADFVSPEQALDSGTVDARTDLYSLGCTFYFLLAGHPPFPEGTLPQRLLSHKTKEPVAIETLRSDVNPGLSAILRKMMAKKPEERFQTAADVSEALREWLIKHANPQWVRSNPALLSGSGSMKRVGDGPSKGDGSRPAGVGPQTVATATTASSTPRATPPSVPVTSRAASGSRSPEVSSTPTAHATEGSTVEIEMVKAPPEGRRRSSRGKAPQAPPGRRRTPSKTRARQNLTFIAAALVSGVGLIAGFVWFGFRDKSPPPPPIIAAPETKTALTPPLAPREAPRRIIKGDITVGPRGHFKTIGEAIAYVCESAAHEILPSGPKPESRTIKVAGWSTYRERIVVENSDFHFPKRLRIVCVDPRRALLAPEGTAPVIRLNGVEEFTLEGIDVEAAGKPTAIELGGYLIGTRLRNFEIRGIKETGIRILGAVGFDRPNSRCALEGAVLRGGGSLATGILFDSAFEPTSNFSVTGCRFFGPFASAVRFEGPVIGVEIKASLFTQAAAGILFQGKALAFRDLAIVNDTFYRLGKGIVFREMPPASCSGLAVQRNVFSQLDGPEMFVASGFDLRKFSVVFASAGTAGNWTSRTLPKPLPPGEINLFINGGKTGVNFQFESTDPADPRFLRPVPKAPHKSAGAIVVK